MSSPSHRERREHVPKSTPPSDVSPGWWSLCHSGAAAALPPRWACHQAPESQKSNQQGPDPDKAEYPCLSLGWANWNVPLSQGPLWPSPALGSPACHPRHLGQGQGSGEIPPAPSQCTLHHGHVSPLLLPAVCLRQGPASSRKTPCPSPAAPCFPP